ncbi:hypothetical protein J5X84_42045 [Streptosporangiaceae bacterium NEAU-GS5]|nr:hypothetical protein [Streptosporangiaceae bacterium NEAU-GS5]
MRRRILIPAVLTAVAGASLVGAGSASATSSTGHTCEKAGWIGEVQGRPTGFGIHSKSGDYLWHASDGFHVRFTQKRAVAHTYSGVITVSAPVVGFKVVKLEKQDHVSLSADKMTITFSIVNHGLIDGFDFKTACADSLTVSELKIGAKSQPLSRVYLGKHRVHPSTIPFTVNRRA